MAFQLLLPDNTEGRMIYRIDRSTIVLALRENHQTAVTIPAGKIVDLDRHRGGRPFPRCELERRAVPYLRSDSRKANEGGLSNYVVVIRF
jgi:hypothetical protein